MELALIGFPSQPVSKVGGPPDPNVLHEKQFRWGLQTSILKLGVDPLATEVGFDRLMALALVCSVLARSGTLPPRTWCSSSEPSLAKTSSRFQQNSAVLVSGKTAEGLLPQPQTHSY